MKTKEEILGMTKEELQAEGDDRMRLGIADLGGLEVDVMRGVWDAPGTVGPGHCQKTVRDVYEYSRENFKKILAYTTIMTVMNRLVEKGILERGKKQGMAYLYSPLVSREDIADRFVEKIVNVFFDGNIMPIIEHLADQLDEGGFDEPVEPKSPEPEMAMATA